jgi:hypothetical protein
MSRLAQTEGRGSEANVIWRDRVKVAVAQHGRSEHKGRMRAVDAGAEFQQGAGDARSPEHQDDRLVFECDAEGVKPSLKKLDAKRRQSLSAVRSPQMARGR